MPTKITVSGVSKKADNGDYKEYDFSMTLDEDITEQQAFDTVMRAVEGESIYRRASQRDDRIQVSYIGVQSDIPSLSFQPRDTKGHFRSYADVGKQLWEQQGRKGIISEWATPTSKEFEKFARSLNVNFATGTASSALRTGLSHLESGVKDYFLSVVAKPARPGSEWRKDSVRRTKSPYSQLLREED